MRASSPDSMKSRSGYSCGVLELYGIPVPYAFPYLGLHATREWMRPLVAVASQIAGLRAALAADASLTGVATLVWADDDASVLQNCDVLLGEPALCGPLVDSCPNLAWLQSTFAGCNQLLTASSRRDYTATRLAGCFGPDMAEYTLMHVLRLERQYDELRACQARGDWADVRSSTLADYRRLPSLTLGVLGLGDIGSDIGSAAAAGFGMRVVGCRRNAAPRASDGAVARVFGLDDLPAFLAAADYLVSVLPSTPATRGLLDGDALAACAGRSPALINVGRGDLVSEATIVAALDRSWLRQYVGDVFAPEPLDAASPLWSHPKVTVTPHNAAVTKAEDVVAAFSENLQRYRYGGAGAVANKFRWADGY